METTTTTENGQTTKKPRITKSYKTELKKSQIRERRMTLLAMLGWSLALIEMAVFIVVFSG